MKQLNNKTTRYLENEEHMAILQCCQILEKAFKKKMFACYVNPEENNPGDVWGIAFAFDLHRTYKEG